MKIVAPLLFGSLVATALVARFAPEQWRWEIIGVIAFVSIFVSMRIVSRVIGVELEKRFDRRE